jgi:LigD, primase-polymerase domain
MQVSFRLWRTSLTWHECSCLFRPVRSVSTQHDPAFPDSDVVVAAPASPIQHYDLLVGSALLLFHRGVTDFTAAEVQYQNQQAAWEARMAAWHSGRIVWIEILKISATTGSQLEMPASQRLGKLFIDCFRNGRGANSDCAYSPRARPGAPPGNSRHVGRRAGRNTVGARQEHA